MLVREKHKKTGNNLEQAPAAAKSRKISPVSRPILSLELGNDYIVWSLHKKTLSSYNLLDSGILAKKDMLNPQVHCECLNEIIDKTGIADAEVNLFLSSPSALLRCIYIPVVPGNELKRVVTWECNKVFPFPVEKTLFDWKVINCVHWGGSKKYEVQCAAIPQKDILPAFDLLRSRGFLINRITLVALSWQEYICQNKFLGHQKTKGNLALGRLVGNDLYLLFFHDHHLEFIHKSNLEEGNLGGGFEESLRFLEDNSPDRLSNSIDTADIDYEIIARNISDSLDYYYGQYSQRSIDKVLISFPQNIRNSAVARLQEILGITVESVLPREEDVGSNCRVPLNLFMPSGFLPRKTKKSLNLVPSEYHQARREKYYFRLMATLSGLVLTFLLIFTFLQYRQQKLTETTRDLLVSALADVKNSDLANKISHLQLRKSNYGSALKSLSNKPAECAALLKALSVLTPEDIRFNELNLTKTQSAQQNQPVNVSVSGYVDAESKYPQVVLADYVNSLKTLDFISNIKLRNRDTGIESEAGNYGFRIEMELNWHGPS